MFAASCPPGWLSGDHPSNCFFISSALSPPLMLSFNDAVSYCNKYEGTLLMQWNSWPTDKQALINKDAKLSMWVSQLLLMRFLLFQHNLHLNSVNHFSCLKVALNFLVWSNSPAWLTVSSILLRTLWDHCGWKHNQI